MKQEIIMIDASQPTNTEAGKFLCQLHYSTFFDDLIDQKEMSGYPHNGSVHSLRLTMKKSDLSALAEIIEDEYQGVRGSKEFVSIMRQQLNSH